MKTRFHPIRGMKRVITKNNHPSHSEQSFHPLGGMKTRFHPLQGMKVMPTKVTRKSKTKIKTKKLFLRKHQKSKHTTATIKQCTDTANEHNVSHILFFYVTVCAP